MELPWPLPADKDLLRCIPPHPTLPTFDEESGGCFLSNPITGLTSRDLIWPLPEPVQKYERIHAAVLSWKPEIDEEGRSVYYTYVIRFEVMDVGQDPTQELASDFALITPGRLDSEVARMTVNLYLPRQAWVKAHLSECRAVALDSDQVELTKRFNTWLFDVVLGKPPVPSGSLPRYDESHKDSEKGYFMIPLRANSSIPVEFDWALVNSTLNSELVYRQKIKFFGGFAKLEASDAECEPSDVKPGQIIMRNGTFSQDDLEDAMVTCAHNGMPCYVTGISKHLDGTSCFPSPGTQTYADYYSMKCGYDLKHKNQPFLHGRRLIRAANYLSHQGTDSAKGDDFPKTNQTLELPPEICSLHKGIKGKLCRGAMRLPSVLYSLEIALVAAELRDQIGIPISCFKVLEALTSRACQGEVNYEALELLGDSILKLTGCTYLFLKDFLETHDQLGKILYEVVRNKTLYYCADARSLGRFAMVDPFAPTSWVPPGRIQGSVQCFSPAKEERCRFQSVSCKTLADIVEALLGAYLMDGGLDTALRAMAWLWVPIKFPASVPRSLITKFFGITSSDKLYKLINVDKLQSKLGYCFKNKNLLAGAMQYEFSESAENKLFKRLEFLGDGILDFVITRHLRRAYPDQDEGKLTDLKQAIRNNENLACVAVLHGLHNYLRIVSPSLEQPIAEYINSFVKEGGKAYGLSDLCAPHGLGDLLQTLSAAIYLDSELDVEEVWRVLKPLLEPLATPLNVAMHPVKELETLCIEKRWKLKILSNKLKDKTCVQAEVWINDLVVCNSQNENKKVARRLAATMVLETHTSSFFLAQSDHPNIARAICSSYNTEALVSISLLSTLLGFPPAIVPFFIRCALLVFRWLWVPLSQGAPNLIAKPDLTRSPCNAGSTRHL